MSPMSWHTAPTDADGVRHTHLGAKAGTGYGACRLDIDLSALHTHPDPLGWWRDHLTARGDEVIAMVERLVG